MTDRANVTASATTMMTATGRSLATLASAARGTILTASAADTIAAIAAKTAGNVVTGDGTDVVSATIATPLAVAPAANRAALGTGADPMTGAAWTDNASAGTSVTWAGGVLTTNINAGTTGGPSTLNASGNTSPEWWDVMARVAVTSSDGDASGNFGLWAGRDATNNVIWILYADGSFKIGQLSGGGYSDLLARTAANTITSPVRTGGQLWLRLSRSPVGLAASWGVGVAGAAPTAWTTVYVAAHNTTRADLSSGSWVQISGRAEIALASALTWVTHAIQSRSPMGWT